MLLLIFSFANSQNISSQVIVHWRKIQSGHISCSSEMLFTGRRFNLDTDLVITGGCSLEEDSIWTQVLFIRGVVQRRKIQSEHKSGHHRWLFTGGRFNQDTGLVINGGCPLEEDSIRTQVWSSQVIVHWRKIQSEHRSWSSQVVVHWRKIQSGHRFGHHR